MSGSIPERVIRLQTLMLLDVRNTNLQVGDDWSQAASLVMWLPFRIQMSNAKQRWVHCFHGALLLQEPAPVSGNSTVSTVPSWLQLAT
jgi:hypothetical protein